MVVVGGGIIGCGILYYLARAGWTDSVLVEANELTSGTTWASSALITHFCSNPFIGRLHRESIALYGEIEREFDEPTEFHLTGSLRLAKSTERMMEYRRLEARAQAEGVRFKVIGADEIRELHPFIETGDLLGAAHTPDDGWVEPATATNALAKAARRLGARVLRNRPVRGLRQLPDRRWRVETAEGDIVADVVVNAAGMWAPVLGAWIDRTLPVVAMERQYYITEPVPELSDRRPELPVLRDPDGTFYLRQETDALLVGPYERQPIFFDVDDIPPEGGQQCLPDFLDRAEEPINDALARVPILRRLGIRAVVNVPTSRGPDGNPLVGPVDGLDGMFVAAGFFAGLSEVAVCRYLVNWITEGEPGIDLWSFDSRRYGDFCTQTFSRAQVAERHVVGLTQAISYPSDGPRGGRPAKTSPLYHRLEARGAHFGLDFGWEVPQWFAPGPEADDGTPSFGRPAGFARAGVECRAIAEGAGLFDATAAAKIELRGPDAEARLRRLCATPIPEAPGRAARGLLLSPKGRIAGTPTILRLAEDRFLAIAVPELERHHLDLLRGRPGDDDEAVTVTAVTGRYGMLTLAGPQGRDILTRLGVNDAAEVDDVLFAELGSAPSWIHRDAIGTVAVWTLICPMEYLVGLYQTLHGAGGGQGPIDVGARALESLRFESGEFGLRRGLTGEDTPMSAGLAGAIATDEMARTESQGPNGGQRLVRLQIHGNDAEPWGGEPIFHDGRPVAQTRTGGYGHLSERSFALATLPSEFTQPGTVLEIDILGRRHRAVVVS